MPDKFLIQQRFKKATQHYAYHATAQQLISQHLYQYWMRQQPNAVSDVLELGCGSGFLSKQLIKLPTLSTLYLNDLLDTPQHYSVPQSCRVIQLIGDMENISFPKVDAIASASAIHWANNIPALLHKIKQALRPGGWFVCATFSTQHYQEIKQLTNIGLNYPALMLYSEIFSDYTLHYQYETIFPMFFAHPHAVLKHCQLTGVTGIQSFRWKKKQLQDFYIQYQKKFAAAHDSVSLTQHVIYLIFRKPQ